MGTRTAADAAAIDQAAQDTAAAQASAETKVAEPTEEVAARDAEDEAAYVKRLEQGQSMERLALDLLDFDSACRAEGFSLIEALAVVAKNHWGVVIRPTVEG